MVFTIGNMFALRRQDTFPGLAGSVPRSGVCLGLDSAVAVRVQFPFPHQQANQLSGQDGCQCFPDLSLLRCPLTPEAIEFLVETNFHVIKK